MWVLSSAALSGLDIPADLAGVERDADDEPTGRLFRLDDWLRDRLPPEPEPDIAAVTRRLASYGITGVTDATPFSSPTALELLARPDLAVRVTAMGGPELTGAPFPERVGAGPVKIVVGDDDLPSIDAIAEAIATAHGVDRPVAVHCVTRAALVLTLAALDSAGSASGDRIEHGAVISPELRDHLAGWSLTVVTQPGFIAAHGDRYREQVDADDLEHLYPCRSLLDAGIEVGGSTDAPFGPEDPWWAIRAAIERRTASGAVLGPDERISPVQALHMWLSRPERPGGPSRHVERGGAADLCLLDAPFRDVIDDPQAGHVRAVICRGEITYSRA
jgi:predicted amidohydrolase YtcJ